MGRLLRSAAALTVLIAGLAFHVRNNGPITLDLYAIELTVPVSWIVVGALVLGVMLGLLATVPDRLHTARLLKRQARELAVLRAASPASRVDPPDGH